MTEPTHRRWFDGTINIPTVGSIIAAMVTATAFGVGLYNSLDRRVQTLEDHDKNQEQHFLRIESDQSQLKSDVKEQLRGIASDVKDTNTKIDHLNDQLYQNSVGNRPDTRRWAK
jgi:hypothetical protein